ncbi:MAG: T9SS type A sorting domain-containing protein [Flavobacteriales bacterium]|nr:T9SS type A sorting domain-containing protein [Bacteroidota bacterium]MCB9241831.1 T9SS type A sorting domain-containing protein [Flavobacteriales bacterium]
MITTIKCCLLSLILIGSGLDVSAQITVNSPATAKIVLVDTFNRVQNMTDFSSLATAKTNGSWDITTATSAGSFLYRRDGTTSTNFANATYNKAVHYNFAGGLSYNATAYQKVDASESAYLGEEIPDEQVISLTLVTGGATDNVTFPVQGIVRDVPNVDMSYPVTNGKNWTSTSKFTTKFNLTIGAFGLNNTAGERKTSRSQTDSVIGWGSIKVKNFATGQFYTIPVLQVSEWVSVQDSFFLGGAQAPAQLLTAFGLTQGQIATYRRVYFYRADELLPLVAIHYEADKPTTMEKMEVMQDRMDENSVGIHKLNSMVDVAIFPNPASHGVITLSSSNLGESVSYELVDVFGRVLRSKMHVTDLQTIDVSDLSSGHYIMNVYQNGQLAGYQKISIQN